MALFTPPEDMLITAISSKQPQVRLERCVGSLEGVFKNAFKKEPRIQAFLASYEANYMKRGLVQIVYDYDVTLMYQENCPASLNDVLIDNGSWEAESVLTKGAPKELTMVTTDENAVATKLSDILGTMLSCYEGINGWNTHTSSFEKMSTYSICRIGYDYIVPMHQLRQYQGKGVFAAKSIWRTILGKARVPQFVKPFLAFSYLTQECCYDQRAFDEVESNPTAPPTDPIPHLAYGPLVEKRGICSGMAWAFKTLMDEANVECICIHGHLKENMNVGHMWNLVKVEGQYYHVDPTWGIKNNGVDINALMQPDSMMRATHVWDDTKFPAARGMRFDYDFVEDYLAENGDDFLDDGANEVYFFPEEIID